MEAGDELTICQKIILFCFRLREKTVLLGELLLTGVADATPQILLPLPINLQTPTFTTFLLLVFVIQHAESWFERTGPISAKRIE